MSRDVEKHVIVQNRDIGSDHSNSNVEHDTDKRNVSRAAARLDDSIADARSAHDLEV